MIPLMTSSRVGLNLTQHAAHGTSLFAVAATGIAGAASYGPGVVQYPEAAAITLTAMVTARWGAQATVKMTSRHLKQALGLLMLAMAPLVPAKAYYLEQLKAREQKEDEAIILSSNTKIDRNDKDAMTYFREHLMAPGMIGIGSGYLAGLFGVGGGTLVVPALAVCTDMNHHQALATSLAAMVLPAVTGTWTHYRVGNCSVAVAPFLAAGALLGAAAGAQLSLHTNETYLRWGFSGLLATLGVRTLLKA